MVGGGGGERHICCECCGNLLRCRGHRRGWHTGDQVADNVYAALQVYDQMRKQSALLPDIRMPNFAAPMQKCLTTTLDYFVIEFLGRAKWLLSATN